MLGQLSMFGTCMYSVYVYLGVFSLISMGSICGGKFSQTFMFKAGYPLPFIDILTMTQLNLLAKYMYMYMHAYSVFPQLEVSISANFQVKVVYAIWLTNDTYACSIQWTSITVFSVMEYPHIENDYYRRSGYFRR